MKVRAVDTVEEKSVQEVEQELLDNHEQQQEEATEVVAEPEQELEQETEQEPVKEFGEEDVLSFIRERYNKEINSVDDLFAEREQSEELPEDVSAFLKYKKETGRGFDDFMRIQKDYDEMSPAQLLREYYAATEEDLDPEDISYLIDQKFGYDEDVDDESEIKQKNIAKKRELAKAKKHFNNLKEQYKVPIESKANPVPQEDVEGYNAYKEYVSQSKTIEEENRKRSEYFQIKTNEVFNDEFKGFEFSVNDQKILFNPGDTKEVKDAQSNVNNFISKYLDDKGLIKDPQGYHRALSAALNPEKMAAFFYEKGKADAVNDVARQSKNINMDVRSAPQQSVTSDGMKIRAVGQESSRGLKIRSRNK